VKGLIPFSFNVWTDSFFQHLQAALSSTALATCATGISVMLAHSCKQAQRAKEEIMQPVSATCLDWL
jgi:hypothetical protein